MEWWLGTLLLGGLASVRSSSASSHVSLWLLRMVWYSSRLRQAVVVRDSVEAICCSHACAELRRVHLSHLRMQAVVVRDDVEAICREVRALSAAHDIVITAGGLGE